MTLARLVAKYTILLIKRRNSMASKTKKTKAARKWKKKPNKANLKKDQKRIDRNLEILRDLEEKDAS